MRYEAVYYPPKGRGVQIAGPTRTLGALYRRLYSVYGPVLRGNFGMDFLSRTTFRRSR